MCKQVSNAYICSTFVYIPCRVTAHLQWLHALPSAKCPLCSPALGQQCLSDGAALPLSPLLKAVDNAIQDARNTSLISFYVVDNLANRATLYKAKH
jgi:hypothetical protein